MEKGQKQSAGKLHFDLPAAVSEFDRNRTQQLSDIQAQLLGEFLSNQKQNAHVSDISEAEILSLRKVLNRKVFENEQREKKLLQMKAVYESLCRSTQIVVPWSMRGFDSYSCSRNSLGQSDRAPSSLSDIVSKVEDLISSTSLRIDNEEFTHEQLTQLWEKTNLQLVSLIQAETKQRIEHLRVYNRRLFTKMDEVVTMKTNANNKLSRANHTMQKFSEAVSDSRSRREAKLENLKEKIEETGQEYARISQNLAVWILSGRVSLRQEIEKRNEGLVNSVESAAELHEMQRRQNSKSMKVIENAQIAYERIREIINNSKFFNLKKPLESLDLEQALKFFSQISYQVVSLNTKFSSLSETETFQMLKLKQLTADLDTLRLSNIHLGKILDHINEMWTQLGHEAMIIPSQFQHALESVSAEQKLGETEISLETFLVTVNLSETEVCRRVISLLQYIEQNSTPHIPILESSIVHLTQLVGPSPRTVSKGRTHINAAETQQKRWKAPPIRKGTFQPLTRNTLTLLPSSFPRSVTDMEAEGTPESQGSDIVLVTTGQDAFREILTDELGMEDDMMEEVLSAFNDIPPIRLYVTKTRFLRVVSTVKGQKGIDQALGLVSTLLSEAHLSLREQYSKRVESLQDLLSSIQANSLTIETQLNSTPLTESQLMQFLRDKQDLTRMAEGFEALAGDRRKLSESTRAILEVKMKTLSMQQRRRSSVQLSVGDLQFAAEKAKEEVMGSLVESNEKAEQRFREKNRGGSMGSLIKRRSAVFRASESISGKIERLSKLKKGVELERGLVEQKLFISEKIKFILDSGMRQVEKETDGRYIKHSRATMSLPPIVSHSASLTDRRAFNLRK